MIRYGSILRDSVCNKQKCLGLKNVKEKKCLHVYMKQLILMTCSFVRWIGLGGGLWSTFNDLILKFKIHSKFILKWEKYDSCKEVHDVITIVLSFSLLQLWGLPSCYLTCPDSFPSWAFYLLFPFFLEQCLCDSIVGRIMSPATIPHPMCPNP